MIYKKSNNITVFYWSFLIKNKIKFKFLVVLDVILEQNDIKYSIPLKLYLM